jgi:hypothetical protein
MRAGVLRCSALGIGCWLAGRPAVVSLAVALLIFAIDLSAARLVVTRSAVGRRVWMFAGGDKRLDQVAAR